MRRVLTVTAALLLAAATCADVVVLADGRRIEGVIVSADEKEVVLDSGLGRLTFKRADVVDLVYKKTRRQIYDEKLEAAESAGDWFALGEWCLENKMRKKAPVCFERALELDPGHEAAHRALGHVLHEGEWMTPQERAQRIAAALEEEMRAKGFVPSGGQWVTPEEKLRLDEGWVQHAGRWMPAEEARRLQGYTRVGDRWVHESEATALDGVAAAATLAGVDFESFVGENALVAGPVPPALLVEICAGLDRGRAWFDASFGSEPGLALQGDRLAEVYVFAEDTPYERTVDHFAALGAFLPEGWADSARRSPGFYIHQPLLISSVRRGYRTELDLKGHSYQHFGHLLLNSLDRNARLLPPWWDEGVACRTEYEVHGKNRVFTRGGTNGTSGTRSARKPALVDGERLRDGEWRRVLREQLERGSVEPLRGIIGLEFSQLEAVDTAAAMAVVDWVASFGPEKARAFHAALRAGQPEPPLRVQPDRAKRMQTHDRALRDLAGVGLAGADGAWRSWFLDR